MTLLFLTNINFVKSQNFGASAGINLSLSTHINRIGFNIGGFYLTGNIQINNTINYYYNFSTLGKSQRGHEFQYSIGGMVNYGPENPIDDHQFLDALTNNSENFYSIGFAYNIYVDQMETTQNTGSISFSAGGFRFVTENDILAFTNTDKFRSAAVMLEFTDGQYAAQVNSLLWHGDAKKTPTIKNDDYPARHGWRDFRDTKYGRFSNGIFSVGFRAAGLKYQNAGLFIGIDSEKVRDIIQNRFVHDLPFIPSSWIKAKNFHYPMLAEDGEPYLYKPNQKIRKDRFYLSLQLNNNIFY